MVSVDDVLVDAFPAEMFQNLVNAVDAVQNGLRQDKTRRELAWAICLWLDTRIQCVYS